MVADENEFKRGAGRTPDARRIVQVLLGVCLAGSACAAMAFQTGKPAAAGLGPAARSEAPAHQPEYTAQGELKLPVDFDDWVFVGSNLGLEYKDPADNAAPAATPPKTGNFHNVYINPEAYAHYRKTGEFPEKTMLVLDIYQAVPGAPKSVVSSGLFPGKQMEVAVAVKNSARPDGSKTDWAYYDFPLGQKTARAFPDKAC